MRSQHGSGRAAGAAMLIKKPSDIPPREITDESAYLTRRAVLRTGALAASMMATGSAYRWFTRWGRGAEPASATAQIAAARPLSPQAKLSTSHFKPHLASDEVPTSFDAITHYNNYYEFSTAKEEVAGLAAGFVTTPWTIRVEGNCAKPATFDLDALAKIAPIEDRIYRHRCVERWSMVIPWLGFPLAKLLDRVQPTSSAKFVAFETVLNPDAMPGQKKVEFLDWPYVEGLRMDEAMHPLTLLACGLYGKSLLPQNGAPWRLVVPWKYGFKGIKAIVKITLVEQMPPTTWNLYAPTTYGFYSNVNPDVDQTSWAQDDERRIRAIGDEEVRPTLPFNGYADQVASLYAGMDLKENF
jgi:sulfoxide reductase catalytic subunit YedY